MKAKPPTRKPPAAAKNHQWQASARHRMQALGMRQEDVAEALGISRPALNHWLQGRRTPNPDELSKLASVLRVTVGELFDGRASDPMLQTVPANMTFVASSKTGAIRVSAAVRCDAEGRWTKRQETPIERGAAIPAASADAYAVVVHGDGLYPVIRSGWLLVIEPERKPVAGDFVLIETHTGECLVRELLIERPDELIFGFVTGAQGRMTLPPQSIGRMAYCYPAPPSLLLPL